MYIICSWKRAWMPNNSNVSQGPCVYRKTKAKRTLSPSSSTRDAFPLYCSGRLSQRHSIHRSELMKLFKCMVREFELCNVVDQVWVRSFECPWGSQSLCATQSFMWGFLVFRWFIFIYSYSFHIRAAHNDVEPHFISPQRIFCIGSHHQPN